MSRKAWFFSLGCIHICSRVLVLRMLLALFICSATIVSGRTIESDGLQYIDLVTVANRLGFKSYWLADNKTFRLSAPNLVVDANAQSRKIYINGMPLYLGFPTLFSNNQLYLSFVDLNQTLLPLQNPRAFGDVPNCKRIAIDAGHGGKDHGATNSSLGLSEKALSFDVARRLQQLLLKGGFEVVQTRREDVYIPLENRAIHAEQRSADLFISIHFNAAESKEAYGYETFALTPQFQASTRYTKIDANDAISFDGNHQDPWNILLAYFVQQNLVDHMGGPDRGIKRARFKVLKDLRCPGVLVELGFLSHRSSAKRLLSKMHRQRLAQSLYDGIIAYQKRLRQIQ